MKQHFIPRVYINNFTFNDSGQVYSIKMDAYTRNNIIKIIHSSQFGYSRNLYTISEKLSASIGVDRLIIEKKAFKYEKALLFNISEKLNQNQFISESDIADLIKMLLSIKQRNKIHYDTLRNPVIQKYLIERALSGIVESSHKYRAIQGDDKIDSIIKLLKKLLEEGLHDKQGTNDVLNSTLLNIHSGTLPKHNHFNLFMESRKIIIYQTSLGNPFITSDNPGFTIHPGNIVGNLNFGSAIAFVFPITPTRLIYIDMEKASTMLNGTKTIEYREANNELINLANLATKNNSANYLFSNSKDMLENIIKT
ncbi:MAG TPA: DUF4238 domain-containing protein [Saprospiraceae bacterium]|nr:DUF4238 domain-containing protein [Saprospiraceae bacterium]